MPQPPIAKRVPRAVTTHGETRPDEYAWLRERTNTEVTAYLEAENAYTAEMMKPTEALREQLYKEILSRVQETDLSVPIRRGAYFYYTRTEEGKAYGIYCRKHGSLDAPEQILLDANLLAAGQNYFRIGDFSVSPDHRLLAYSTDFEGDETHTVSIKDLETGTLLEDRIETVSYSLEWANDNRTLFYTMMDAARRPYQVFRHQLGEAADTLIFQEDDERFALTLHKSLSDAWLFIVLGSPLTTEFRYLDANHPQGEFRPMLPRRQDTEYDAVHHGDYFYIRTNDRAKGFRVVRTPTSAPSEAAFEEIVPGRPGITVEGLEAFRNHLVIFERERGLEKIAIRALPSGDTHYIEFPEPVYTVSPGGNAEYDSAVLRFVYGSLITPASVYDYDMHTRDRTLLKQQPVLGGYDPTQYDTERIFATAADGVEVPVSLVYRKGLRKDGRNPLLLYAYGSYGISTAPAFSSDRLSLLDRGFVFAIAHIRGGADLGKEWHDAGKLLNKKNTFTDFVASAEHLIAARYTSPDRLAIMGGSAGGLLVGAVLNLRPDLFGAAIAKVPYVDTLNSGLDPTLPLTVGEYEEWGNPEERQYFDYIKTYAPYENVRAAEYPAMLVTGGLNDPRVSYWEPAKWVARLRAVKTGDKPLLLKTEMGAGHFGPSGRYDRMRETAFDYGFLLWALGGTS
ncbi:MAG: S9 family peptidase [Acidobacteriota bacterium]|nr:S9 family peptidase [Acidobacteriota bacterium]